MARLTGYGSPDLFMRSAIFASFAAVLLLQIAAASELELLQAAEANLAATASDSPEHVQALTRLGAYYRAMQKREGVSPSWNLFSRDYFALALSHIKFVPRHEPGNWADAIADLVSVHQVEGMNYDNPQVVFLESLLNRAITIKQASGVPDDVRLAALYTEAARMPTKTEAFHLALVQCDWLVKRDKTLAPLDSGWAPLLVRCAESSVDSKQFENAKHFGEAARLLLTGSAPDLASEVVRANLSIATASARLKDWNSVGRASEAALKTCDVFLGAQHYLRVKALLVSAEALAAAGDKKQASNARREGRDLEHSHKKNQTNPRLQYHTVLFKVDPTFDPDASAHRYDGTTVFLVEVLTDGSCRFLLAYNRLEYHLTKRAAEAVQKWRFKPALLDGRPVPIAAQVEVNFAFR